MLRRTGRGSSGAETAAETGRAGKDTVLPAFNPHDRTRGQAPCPAHKRSQTLCLEQVDRVPSNLEPRVDAQLLVKPVFSSSSPTATWYAPQLPNWGSRVPSTPHAQHGHAFPRPTNPPSARRLRLWLRRLLIPRERPRIGLPQLSQELPVLHFAALQLAVVHVWLLVP